LNSDKLAEKCAALAWNKKGRGIMILDVRELTDMTDFFVLVSAESEPHAKALTDHLEDELEKEKIKAWHREGYNNLNWVLLDFIDVVVHIFRDRSRQFYDLEKLWGDARIVRLEEDAEDRLVFAREN
jgi:ribosome-associated protein